MNTSVSVRFLYEIEDTDTLETLLKKSKYRYKIQEKENTGIYRIRRRHKWFPFYSYYGWSEQGLGYALSILSDTERMYESIEEALEVIIEEVEHEVEAEPRFLDILIF